MSHDLIIKNGTMAGLLNKPFSGILLYRVMITDVGKVDGSAKRK